MKNPIILLLEQYKTELASSNREIVQLTTKERLKEKFTDSKISLEFLAIILEIYEFAQKMTTLYANILDAKSSNSKILLLKEYALFKNYSDTMQEYIETALKNDQDRYYYLKNVVILCNELIQFNISNKSLVAEVQRTNLKLSLLDLEKISEEEKNNKKSDILHNPENLIIHNAEDLSTYSIYCKVLNEVRRKAAQIKDNIEVMPLESAQIEPTQNAPLTVEANQTHNKNSSNKQQAKKVNVLGFLSNIFNFIKESLFGKISPPQAAKKAMQQNNQSEILHSLASTTSNRSDISSSNFSKSNDHKKTYFFQRNPIPSWQKGYINRLNKCFGFLRVDYCALLNFVSDVARLDSERQTSLWSNIHSKLLSKFEKELSAISHVRNTRLSSNSFDDADIGDKIDNVDTDISSVLNSLQQNSTHRTVKINAKIEKKQAAKIESGINSYLRSSQQASENSMISAYRTQGLKS